MPANIAAANAYIHVSSITSARPLRYLEEIEVRRALICPLAAGRVITVLTSYARGGKIHVHFEVI